MPIDKSYQPADVEGRIYQTWEAAQAFRCGRPERSNAAPYTIVILVIEIRQKWPPRG